MSSLHALTDRIRAEFTELPGLKVTHAQACRLWHADAAQCRAALEALAAEGFLRQVPSGAFVALPRPRGHTLRAPLDAARPTRCPFCHHLNSIQVEKSMSARETSATFRCAACSRVVNVGRIPA